MIYYVATMIAKADYIDNTNLDMVGIINIQHPDIQTSKHPTPGKVNFFFFKVFLQEMWMHQELLLANILKFM